MQHFMNNKTFETVGTVLPLAILLIESDEEREFLTEMYLKYRPLMYKTAIGFLGKGNDEVEEAVGASIERMCKYCRSFQAVECNNRAAYVVMLVGNVCRDLIRKTIRQRDVYKDTINEQITEEISDTEDIHEIVFDRVYANDLLNSFDKLNERERELILMRHVDRMEYDEMATALHMNEGTVRTALSRAKKHLETLGKSLKGEMPNG